jgi:hypothetical protein
MLIQLYSLTFFLFTLIIFFISLNLKSKFLPIKPVLLNLPILFTAIFIIFFSLPLFISEFIYSTPISSWLFSSAEVKINSIIFLSIYLIIFWLGYLIHFKKVSTQSTQQNTSYITIAICLLLSSGILMAYYISLTGGLYQFIFNHRNSIYDNQWFYESSSFFSVNRTIIGFIFVILAVVGGYFSGVHRSASRLQQFLYFLLPLPGTILRLAIGSRAFFLSYFIFFITRYVTKQKYKNNSFFLPLLIISFSFAGMTLIYFSRDKIQVDNLFDAGLQIIGSFNGISSLFDTVNLTLDENAGSFSNILYQLSPIPSFIYSKEYISNLTVLIHGYSIGSSNPMPYFGEIFYNMGWMGLVMAYFHGALVAFVNRNAAILDSRNKIWWLLLYMCLVVSFFYMGHSGVRAISRPFVWMSILFISYLSINKFLPKKKINNPLA